MAAFTLSVLSLFNLPKDVLGFLFSKYIPREHLLQCRLVCKPLRELLFPLSPIWMWQEETIQYAITSGITGPAHLLATDNHIIYLKSVDKVSGERVKNRKVYSMCASDAAEGDHICFRTSLGVWKHGIVVIGIWYGFARLVVIDFVEGPKRYHHWTIDSWCEGEREIYRVEYRDNCLPPFESAKSAYRVWWDHAFKNELRRPLQFTEWTCEKFCIWAKTGSFNIEHDDIQVNESHQEKRELILYSAPYGNERYTTGLPLEVGIPTSGL